MKNIEWVGNSKKMHDAIVQGVPSIFRGSVQSKISAWIEKNNINAVTEDMVFQAVDEIAHANLAKTIKPKLETLRTK